MKGVAAGPEHRLCCTRQQRPLVLPQRCAAHAHACRRTCHPAAQHRRPSRRRGHVACATGQDEEGAGPSQVYGEA